MKKPLSVLLVEDNPDDADMVLVELRRAGFEPTWKRVQTEPDFLAEIKNLPDIVISDYTMPEFNGISAAELLQASGLDIPFILVSGTVGEEVAVEAMQHGATDFLLKDRLVRLGSAVERALREMQAHKERKKVARALHESEAEFSILTEAMPQIVWVTRADGWNTYFNQRWMDYTGLTREESAGHGWNKPFHPDDQERAREAWHRAVTEIGTYSVEARLRRADGVYRWWLVRGVPQKDTDGNILKWVGTCTDIHDVKLAAMEIASANRALQQQKTELQVLFDLTPAMIWLKDTNNGFVRVNRRVVETTGMRIDEIEGKSAYDIFPKEAEGYFANDLEVIRSGAPKLGIVEQLRGPAGEELWVQTDKVPVFDQEGKVTGLLAMVHDITARKQAETRIQEQAALIDQTHDAIIVRDLDHRIVFWSKGAERVYGWTAAEAVGSPLDSLLHVDRAKFDEADRIIREKGEWNGESEKVSKAGAKLVIDARWTMMRDPEGRPKSILTIDTDITERKKIEQQFLRAQRLESIGTLAGGIAHDLNNLLSPIVMGVDLLKQFDGNPRSLPVLENIGRSAKRGTDLVRQVLSFARGIEGTRIAMQVLSIIREVESIAASTFPKNIAFHTEIAPDLWLVTADPSQINQVLLNLCVNARDAMPDGGRLDLTVSNVELDEQYAAMDRNAVQGRYVVVKVTDSGCGMPQSVIDRIFEPFFTTKDVSKGTGLGLSTVLGIVRSHGGFVKVYSEPGKGSVFTVYLPALADGGEAVVHDPEAGAIPRGNGELILVVDDEVSILDITKQTLEVFGYKVITAEDGAQAIGLYALHRETIAVVLTDMMMPVMDGPALIAALRRINPAVNVIAASGLNAKGSDVAAARMGVKHFLSKPYSAEALLKMLKTVRAE